MYTPWVCFDGKNCDGCKHLNERGYCEFTACIIPCTVRATIPEVKPLTNADLIRSATDEELAEFMANNVGCDDCRFFATCRSAPQDRACAEKWLDWLKQEAET